MQVLGDYINGVFLPATGLPLRSYNPVSNDHLVFDSQANVEHIDLACQAASAAQAAWSRLTLSQRCDLLYRFRDALSARASEISAAITSEMGKLKSEADGEVRALIGRFASVHKQIQSDLAQGPLPGFPQEWLRYQPHGVVGVIGPYNYPLHLCHAHAIPALMTGNAVVIKPSEITPLSAQIYAQAAHDANLPPGVLNIVQGAAESGKALVEHPLVRGLCFTGSYPTGRRILESALDRPELLVALEMGGKNTAVVLRDADLRQAAHEILIGGYLTTGQRCTCTDRVLIERSQVEPLLYLLKELVSTLRFGDPNDGRSFAGPMATRAAKARYEQVLQRARAGGAECLVRGKAQSGGAFVAPTLHLLDDSIDALPGYTDEELFGPDLCVQAVDGLEHAAELLNASAYGLTNSVFTQDRANFESLYSKTRSGILNWNRTTNQASPRLPFGGVGRSGNFRPAGAHAARNVVFPVAIQAHPFGVVDPHPHLEAKLPAPDLDQLEATHREEERVDMERNLIDQPRPMGVRLPIGGRLPQSSAWLQRLYAGGRMVKEKKPGVFDHVRSFGPWMVSVDDEPLAVLDGMSQTATLPAGFSADVINEAYEAGDFGDSWWVAPDTSYGSNELVDRYEARLLELMPGLSHVSFVNSGAEANEKAFALCQLNAKNPKAKRLLAFKGSFHGRTMLSLHATWNPKKRGPYELKGYEARFVDFPTRFDDRSVEPAVDPELLCAAGQGDIAKLIEIGQASQDELLNAEVASLAQVDEQLRSSEIFACIIEPMQSEGGDRYATARFYQMLRLLTRHHDVSLIMDEVQTGMGLGPTPFWYTRFNLVAADGTPDAPDVVTVAKRAQVGVCASRFTDPAPTSSHVSSLVRGRIHADFISDDPHVKKMEAMIKPRLEDIAIRYPQWVGDPRVDGYAFAFDLPSPELLKAYLGQRFWRGCVVFGAGTRTVRYRLSAAFNVRHLDLLFESLRRSLSWLDAHPGQSPPHWEDPKPSARPEMAIRVRAVDDDDDAGKILDAIMALEERVYEPARRDSRPHLLKAIEGDGGVAVVAEVERDGGWHLIGSALGAPLELYAGVEGPNGDPNLGAGNTLYSTAITVDPQFHGHGLGRKLKQAQLREARAVQTKEGTSRYRYVTGRNRVGLADAMAHLNRAFGAQEVARFDGQYGDPNAQAVYYRIALCEQAPSLGSVDRDVDLSSGISQPLAKAPESIKKLWEAGRLRGPLVNKITICNYVTPEIVRAVEWVSTLCPRLPHLYLTSCRDEALDKSLRVLRTHRGAGRVTIGLEGGYFGHTTAAARSLSDPSTHEQGPGVFDWPRIPHPAEVGAKATLDALNEAVRQHGGADQVLGFVFEFLQERTGRVIPDDFWSGLQAWRERTKIPVVVFETASNSYRVGNVAFGSSLTQFKPDLMAWWAGGQLGFIHVSKEMFVSTPLTMVSTWDGDEMSMIRVHHRLRALRNVDVTSVTSELDNILMPIADKVRVEGMGLHRVLYLGELATTFEQRMRAHDVRIQVIPGGRVVLAPSIDLPRNELGVFVDELSALL